MRAAIGKRVWQASLAFKCSLTLTHEWTPYWQALPDCVDHLAPYATEAVRLSPFPSLHIRSTIMRSRLFD